MFSLGKFYKHLFIKSFMVIDTIKEELLKRLSIVVSPTKFLVNLLIAIILITVGIVIGKITKFSIRKGLERIKIDHLVDQSFVNLSLVIIKWSIYVLFINLALIQLGIPQVTNPITTILGVLPALTGALIIISAGFAIGSYIKKIIIESKIKEGKLLSQILFYFISYIFMIFAFKTALITLKDQFIVNLLLLIFISLGGIALLIYYFKKK